jgi:hypothetical protein
MDIIIDIIVPIISALITILGTVVAVVMYITKHNANHDKDREIIGMKIQNIIEAQNKMMSNHFPHLDAKLDEMIKRVDYIDKELYAHLKLEEERKKVYSN